MNWAGGMDRKKDFRSRCYHAVAPIAVAIEEGSLQRVLDYCGLLLSNFVIIDLSTFSNIESVQYPHMDNYNMDPLTFIIQVYLLRAKLT